MHQAMVRQMNAERLSSVFWETLILGALDYGVWFLKVWILLYLERQVPYRTPCLQLYHVVPAKAQLSLWVPHTVLSHGWPENVSAHMGLQHRALSCGGLTWLSRGTIDARNWPEMKQHGVWVVVVGFDSHESCRKY